MRMRKKGISRFAFVWIVVIVLIAAVWSVLMLFVCEALREYEATRPDYEAERIFGSVFRDGDPEKIMPYINTEAGEFESEKELRDYLSTVISAGEIGYKEVISPDSTVKMYAVSAGEIVFASFTVGDGERTTDLVGIHYPELKSVQVQLSPQFSVSLFLPLSARATVNGKPVDPASVSAERFVLEDELYFPDDDDDFRVFLKYEIKGLFAEPEIEAELPGIGPLELRYDAVLEAYSGEYSFRSMLAGRYNDSVKLGEARRQAAAAYREWIEAERLRLEEEERQAVSDSIQAVYGDFIRDMSRQDNKFIYAKTTTQLRADTRVYFKTGTDIYKYVNSGYYNYAIFVMKTIDYSNEDSSYYEWLDDSHKTFKCRISADVNMTGTLDGAAVTDTEFFRMTAYVDISGAKPLVYKLVTTESDLANSD